MADTTTKKPDAYKEANEFRREYANHIKYESTPLDLTLIFGNMRPGASILQHTAMTLTWPYVKLMLYYLQANLAIHESRNGTVAIPQSLHPKLPSEDSQVTPDIFEAINKIYEEFIKRL